MATRVYSPRRDITVRTAVRDDLPAVLAIYNHAVEHTTATYDLDPVDLANRIAWFDARTAAGFPILVAEAGARSGLAETEESEGVGQVGGRAAEILGWASYGGFRPEKRGWDPTVEHSVYVAPAAQSGGVGTALLGALIEHARNAGRHSMLGLVDADNAGSVAFHLRHGFIEVGRIREGGLKFGRRLDVAILQMRL